MTSLRVMSANLWAHNSDPGGLARVLVEVAPDILAVQELQAPNAEVISAHFPNHGLAPHGDTLGSGVASRYPSVIERVPMAYRSGWALRVIPEEWPGNAFELEVMNVHLANPIGWPWWRSVDARANQLGAIERALGSRGGPQIVVGDFNASPVWPAYRRMRRSFEDAATVAGTAAPTWAFRGLGRPLLRIDHAFTRRVRPIRTFATPVPGADHLALVLDVELE